MSIQRLICFAALVLGLVLLAGWLPAPVQAQDGPTATPTLPDMPPMPSVDRLAPPPTVFPPTQAGDGAQVYYQVCMTCHGDRGQGLTEEWRLSLDPEDQNCWQSGCHHTRRPPQGFIFPHEVPRVVGGGALVRFATALELHDYLVQEMPYQFPGSLKTEEYWQLTAYLLEKNGVSVPTVLDSKSAARVKLGAVSQNPQQLPASVAIIAALAGLAVVVLTVVLRAVRRQSP